MQKRVTMISLLVLLLALTAGVIHAQDVPPVFCGSLAEADCAILENAQKAVAELTGATFDLNFDLNLDNIPDAPFDTLAINLSGAGAYAIDPAIMEKLAVFEGDPMAIFEDMEQIGQLVEDALTAFDGQLNLTLTLPPEVLAEIAKEGIKLPEKLSVELRMVDGVGYVNLSALAEAIPDAGIPGGWYGLEIAKLLNNVFVMLAPQMEGMMGMLPGFDAETITQFSDPAVVGDFMNIERVADADVNGEAVAVFKTTLDYVKLFSNPALTDMMKSQMDAAGAGMSEADLEQMMEMMREMYKGLTFDVTEYVGLADGLPRQLEMRFYWDMTGMMSAMGEVTTQVSAPAFGANFTIVYGNFNTPPAITAPEGAVVLTAEEAIQMFMGGMGAMSGS
ncbi:MAG: hypothetical protein HXY41_15785 [Chloroflexi bacterium]|nr:hypothetical protein [Chloroflexota bacterium]